jgi:two-component sensor histidine kinase
MGGAGLRSSSARVPNALRRIADVATLSRQSRDLKSELLPLILDTAIDLVGAAKGDIQLLDQRTGALLIATQRGFDHEFLKFFERVEDHAFSACGTAMKSRQQVIVADVDTSPVFDGTEALQVLLGAGVRAVVSTPLVTGGGDLVGMLSVHFSEPFTPDPNDLSALSLLANVAADQLDRAQTRQLARWRSDTLEAVLDVVPMPVWIASDPDCREIHGNSAAAQLLDVDRTTNVSQSATKGGTVQLAHYQGARRLHPDELPLQRAASSGRAQKDQRLDLELPDGRRITVSGASAPLFDDDGHVRGAVAAFADITALQRAQDAQIALARELQHRSNNLLTVVQSLARRTLASAANLEEASEKLQKRLLALARADFLVSRSESRSVPIGDIVMAAMEPFEARTVVDGEDVALNAMEVQNLTLAIHELATNALKYGALSNDAGRVAIRWRLEDGQDGRWVRFSWRELGGPAVLAPTRTGLGTQLLRSMYRDIELVYDPAGFNCGMRLRLGD